MKMTFFLFLLFCSFNSFGQDSSKKVEIYYRLDTSKVPVKENMWKIDTDYPYKYFILQCPCLPNGGKPSFSYLTKDTGKLITEKEMQQLIFIDISKLIVTAKFIIKNNSNNYSIFFVESIDGIYKVHKVKLTNVEKQDNFTDYENIKRSDTTKKRN